MITEISCIAVGIPLGFALRHRQAALRCVDRLTSWSIYALLFLLGLSLGSDDELISRAGDLGMRAVVISLCSLMGSVFAARALQRLLPADVFGAGAGDEATRQPSSHGGNGPNDSAVNLKPTAQGGKTPVEHSHEG